MHVAGAAELSVGRRARCAPTQRAPRRFVRAGSRAMWFTGGFSVTGSRQAVGRRTHPLKCRQDAQVEGTCRSLACSDARTEDVVEDAGRAEGGCSARQPPG